MRNVAPILVAVATLAAACGKSQAQICADIGATVTRCTPTTPPFSAASCVASLASSPSYCQAAALAAAECYDGKTCVEVGAACSDQAAAFATNCPGAGVAVDPNATQDANTTVPQPTPTPIAQPPLAPGSYTATGTLDASASSCPAGACAASVGASYQFTYAPGVYHVVSSDGYTADAKLLENNQIQLQPASTSITNQDGCPTQQAASILLTLGATSFTGRQLYTRTAQACSGHGANTCICAYNLRGQ